jgi:cytochrome b involved in lipid metabolism
MSKEFSEEEVAAHSTESDCWLIIGNDSNGGAKVYNITPYMNDHPGGPEIMLEFAGKDADDMFEDIGHSSEARNKMKDYLVGTLKVDPNAPKKEVTKKAIAKHTSKGGLNPLAILALLVAIAIGYYYSQMSK